MLRFVTFVKTAAMKKLFYLFPLLFVTIVMFGQDTSYHPVSVNLLEKFNIPSGSRKVSPADTIAPEAITGDSTGVLGYRDIMELEHYLTDLPHLCPVCPMKELAILWLLVRYKERVIELRLKSHR